MLELAIKSASGQGLTGPSVSVERDRRAAGIEAALDAVTTLQAPRRLAVVV